MLTQASKLFLTLAGVAVGAAGVYAAASGDVAGVALLGFVAAAGAFVGVSALRYRANEVAPPVPEGPPFPSPRPVRRQPPPRGGGPALVAGLAAGLALGGFVLGPTAAIAGVVLGLLAAAAWLATLSFERTGRAVNLQPLGLPLAGACSTGALIYLMSRILLVVPTEGTSTAIAGTLATGVLVGGVLVATRPSLSARRLVGPLAFIGVVFLTGGIAAAVVGERPPAGERTPGPASITAHDTRFDRDLLEFRAGRPALIHFMNKDGVPHNVAIYRDELLSKTIFSFEPIPGPTVQDFRFEAPAAGQYFFRCDVHPQMNGKVIVQAGVP